MVGHFTLRDGDNVRTGVTTILPHSGNIFRDKVAAAVYVANGFGKLIGSTQIEELGVIESPVVLTNTLSVWRASEALAEFVLNQRGNEDVHSVNVIVGETNDGILNDIRGMHVQKSHVMEAIANARSGFVPEGCVGAGTGTIAFGFKAGIGTSSRLVPIGTQQYSVGVLVQSNFGGVLTIDGLQIGKELSRHILSGDNGDGSVMIIVATDAPLDARQLKRIAMRTMLGVSRTGSPITNGSGDYAVAFSVSSNRTPSGFRHPCSTMFADDKMTPLFQATVEATEEAIYNSLFMAKTTKGMNGTRVEALSLGTVRDIMEKYRYKFCDSK
jgi:D-aminopeptidase